jgi:hypothetical protein
MPGLLDKIKGLLGGKSQPGAGAGAKPLETLKGKAGDVKDKVDELVDKVGEKVPPKVKDAYEKVSDKVEDLIPGKKDADTAVDPTPEGTGAEAAIDIAEGNPYADPDGATPAN